MNNSKLKFALSFIILILLFTSSLFAQVHVHGYYRKDGTYVKGYVRTKPDHNPYNNYSFPGNYNPNTGKITTGKASTYLRHYYDKSKKHRKYYYRYNKTSTTTYQYCTKKKRIKLIQTALKLTGHNPGKIDGIWGPKTSIAVLDLQQDHHIDATGRINQKTIQVLINELKKVSTKEN